MEVKYDLGQTTLSALDWNDLWRTSKIDYSSVSLSAGKVTTLWKSNLSSASSSAGNIGKNDLSSAGKGTPTEPRCMWKNDLSKSAEDIRRFLIFPDVTDEEIAEYNEKYEASGGFDVDEIKGRNIGFVFPVDLKKQPAYLTRANKLAKLATQIYNKKNEKNYEFLKVVKVNTRACGASLGYYITFEAELDPALDTSGAVQEDGVKTFQALGYTMPGNIWSVDFCRTKDT